MSVKYMSVVNSNTQRAGLVSWETKQELSADGNGEWIIIPDGIQTISVTAIPSGGASCKVQLTTSPLIDVINNIADPIDWDDGLITSAKGDVFFPVSAIRLLQSGAGQSKLTVRAQ